MADLSTKCLSCNGSGVIAGDEGTPRICPVCGGNGHMTESWVYAYKERKEDDEQDIKRPTP